MNYIHHAILGVGTASLGVLAAEALGAPLALPVSLGIGAVVTAAGAISTDLDHPRSFISHSIPSRIVRVSLAVLAVPLLATLGALLTTRDPAGTWEQFLSLTMGIHILRWSLIALGLALGLMLLSWMLYKSLHHRGPLHSLVFAAGVTLAACLAFWGFGSSWIWGLCFGWGWLWHILADGLTEEGVPFFWPFRDDRLHTLPPWGRRLGAALLSLGAIGGIFILLFIRLRLLFT
jgi:membrane-bound metal-dependent hydrolase YbcI (DUF457 family)